MTTKLEGIAKKAQQEQKFRFTSLAHHITKDLVWESLGHIDLKTTPGIDGMTVKEAKDTFQIWIDPMIQSMHSRGYKPPAVKQCWIPKPGKQEKRPIGIPGVKDRALQRSVAMVLTSIYEQDFLSCSFGGRPGRSAHQALATLNEIIAGKKISWVYEADLKNYFGSLNHDWLIKFVEHRIGDPRIVTLIKRWLKAGVFENGNVLIPELGTPQGGSISVLLSNVYLHYVLDLWFEKIVKPRMTGEAYLIRYIDDFVVCFQYRADAMKFQEVLVKRLAKFSLALEPNKTRLIEFGRFAQKHAARRSEKVETLYFLGFTHFCTRNRKGNFMVGRKTEKTRFKTEKTRFKTEKTRFKRGMQKIKALVQEIMHYPLKEQMKRINQFMRGHYAYYGMGGNLQALRKIYHHAEKSWRIALSKRSQKSYVTWEKFSQIRELYPILKPSLKIPYEKMQAMAIL
jgi:group II intron reverse transcriptase/maturase